MSKLQGPRERHPRHPRGLFRCIVNMSFHIRPSPDLIIISCGKQGIEESEGGLLCHITLSAGCDGPGFEDIIDEIEDTEG
eukprot:1904931-Amphidinium_carterae.1